MKKYLILALAVLLLAGCQAQDVKVDSSASGDSYNVDISSEEGDVNIQGTVENGDEWCKAGSTWSATSAQANANMIIVGLVDSGKYAGYCHVTYDVTSDQGTANVDFYFTEEGAGYQVTTVNGQTYESAWSG